MAFANTQGGTLYIGVNDDGEVVGIANPDTTITQLSNLLHDAIKPDILMFTSLSVQEFAGKYYIEAQIRPGNKRPYYLASKGPRPEGVYVRIGAANVPSTDTAILTMIKGSEHDSFELHPTRNQALTFEYVQQKLKENNIEFKEGSLRILGAKLPDGTFTNFGQLISDQCQCTLKAAVFADNDRTVFTSRQSFEGSVLKQLDEAYAYIVEHTPYITHIHGLQRVDKYDVPLIALRETLVNAVAHREYGIDAPTIISILPAGIQFVSIGGLPLGIDESDLQTNISVPRNSNLTNLLYRLAIIEAYGTGISRIRKSYKGSSDVPEFTITNNSFSVFLPNLNAIDLENSDKHTAGELPKTVSQTHELSLVAEVADNPEEQTVLNLLKSSPQTRAQIEKQIQRSQTYTNRLLSKLIEDRLIRRVGRGKSSRYTLV